MSSAVEIVTTTEEDAVNPFLTTVLVEGIVIARGASNNKKSSRQVAARQALAVLCPLIEQPTELGKGMDGLVGGRQAMVERAHGSFAHIETLEAEALNLPLSDDSILDAQVGKTPVMVLQEHCHKHVGKLPVYSAAQAGEGEGGNLLHRITVQSGSRLASGVSGTKKRAKQAAALDMLRQLYPHVERWGELVASTNSRQREEKLAQARARRAPGTHAPPAAPPAPPPPPPPPPLRASPQPPHGGASGARDGGVGRGGATTSAGVSAGAVSAHSGVSDATWAATYRSLSSDLGVTASKLRLMHDTLWDQVAAMISEGAELSLRPEPTPSSRDTAERAQ
mmetsp:Transcript_23470/g.77931  ORF Transcript_23470/g.77931 Transcript_23470/m.77931 type:complete len:337 (+) Transcript_23470:1092-2102(+)